MTPDNNLCPEQIYTKHLHTINGIKFTPREIDIIACIVAGKNPQSIASFLSFSTKTIELQTVNTHIVNIRRKIDGSARAQILEFIEKSDKHKFVHDYYVALTIRKEFIQSIMELTPVTARLIKKVYFITANNKNKELISYLQNHFRIIDIDVIIVEEGSQTPLSQLKNLAINTEFAIHFTLPTAQYEPLSHHLFLLSDENISKNSFDFKYIFLKDYQNYYYLLSLIFRMVAVLI